MSDNIIYNRLSKIATSQYIGNHVIAITLGISNLEVASWMNNSAQPNSEQIEKLMKLFEVSYSDLIFDGNEKTIKTLQERFDILTQNKKMSLRATSIDEETGKKVRAYNPELVKAIKDLEKKLMKKLEEKSR